MGFDVGLLVSHITIAMYKYKGSDTKVSGKYDSLLNRDHLLTYNGLHEDCL